MSDIITLSSSDEEDVEPPKKRIKPFLIGEVSVTLASKKRVSPVVILSDDETEDKVLNVDNNEAQICVEGTVDRLDSVIIPNTGNVISICDTDIADPLENGIQIDNDEYKKKEDCLITDENSSQGSSEKENHSENNVPELNGINEPSTSTLISTDDRLLEKYLQVCGESVTNSQYEHLKEKQFPILRKYYKKCCGKLNDSSGFSALLEENITRAQKSAATAVISFNEILQYVKEVVNAESIDVPEEKRLKLKILEKTIKRLLHRIKQLENSELNFDAEEDSTYLQLERYVNRLNKVYKKYCELLEKNPFSGRITYEKLDFVHSEYNEINRAISRKYKNNEKFPSYYEVEQYIRKVVTEHKLDLSELKIKSESLLCFQKLGELLQARRKKELYDSHYLYIRDTDDPATIDNSLDSTLRQSFADGQSKIEKICEEYRIKEELGEDLIAEVSESSDESEKEDN